MAAALNLVRALEIARRACPEFHPADGAAGRARRTLKTCLFNGELGGAPAIAKVLVHPDPLWRWYFEREVTLYQRFALEPPPVRAPRLHAADAALGVLVLERLGAALSPGRHAARVDAADLAALLEALGRLGAWDRGLDLAPMTPPARGSLRSMRARLLEDPSGGLAWFLDGFRRCHQLGFLREEDAARMTAALEGHPTLGFCHGDLLLRNVLHDGDGLALVDWECAGAHPQDWDLALLWAGLPAASRPQVEEAVLQRAAESAAPARWAAFLAGVAFALAREIKFARAARGGAPGRLTATMDQVQERLREALARSRTTSHGPARVVPAGAHHAIHVGEVNEAMSLKAQLEDEHKQAMKRRDQRTTDVIRMIKTKITERYTGPAAEVEDAVVVEAIAAYRKQLKNSLDAFHAAGAQGEEHADALVFEIAFCERFLPAALDEAALRALVGERITALGITDAKQFGKLIGDIMKTHKGLAEAAEIRRIAEEILKG